VTALKHAQNMRQIIDYNAHAVDAHSFIPTPIHVRDIFNANQQDHVPTPATKLFPSMMYEDDRTPPGYPGDMYEEYGMNTEVCEPWEFEDQLSKAPSYYGEPDVLREARKGNRDCTELLRKKWMFVGSQYSNGVHKMWREHEAEHQERIRQYEEDLREWEEQELEFEREEREWELKELAREPSPPVPADALFPPSPTYETAIRHQPAPAPYAITRSRPPPWPNKKRNRNQHGSNNIGDTPARPTVRPRPPPWPNKKSNRNQYWSNGNRYTPARITTKRRPPPWPNRHPSTHPILSIADSRPPPWPNQHHCYHCHRRNTECPITQTPHARPPPWPILFSDHLQNRWNARRRLRRRSRTLPIA
jgi:hypothetical protein